MLRFVTDWRGVLHRFYTGFRQSFHRKLNCRRSSGIPYVGGWVARWVWAASALRGDVVEFVGGSVAQGGGGGARARAGGGGKRLWGCHLTVGVSDRFVMWTAQRVAVRRGPPCVYIQRSDRRGSSGAWRGLSVRRRARRIRSGIGFVCPIVPPNPENGAGRVAIHAPREGRLNGLVFPRGVEPAVCRRKRPAPLQRITRRSVFQHENSHIPVLIPEQGERFQS